MIRAYQDDAEKTNGEQAIFIKFPYDASTVARVKALAGRQYHPDTKEWEIPLTSFKQLMEDFDISELVLDESIDVDAINDMEKAELDNNPQVQTNIATKTATFDKELAIIADEDIRSFTRVALSMLPDYFYKVAASSTGKYHPAYALGDGGLVRHTKAAARIANELFRCESVFLFKQREQSCILAALLLHDGLKHGTDGSEFTVAEHPLVAANFIDENKHLLPSIDDEAFNLIQECIATHMGQWNTDYKGREILPVPENRYHKFTHLCDYLASRKCIEFNFTV
jgi:hypothetical protein